MAIQIIRSSFNFSSPFNGNLLPAFLLVNMLFIFMVELFQRKQENYSAFIVNTNPVLKTLIFVWMLFGILVFSALDNIPFIYFQF
jgi:hypothetical protein